jgi:hypothetical protein
MNLDPLFLSCKCVILNTTVDNKLFNCCKPFLSGGMSGYVGDEDWCMILIASCKCNLMFDLPVFF